jgi:outer membrane immunogenic protein
VRPGSNCGQETTAGSLWSYSPSLPAECIGIGLVRFEPRILRNTRIVIGAFMNTRALFVWSTAALATSALSSVASAADLAPASQAYVKAPMMPPATNWSGFYAGVNLGYGWGNNDTDLADATPAPNAGATDLASQSLSVGSRGVIGGGQAGYNWQMGSFVTGLEADIQGSGVKGSATQSKLALITPTVGLFPTSIDGSSDQKLSWFGTFRGRVGTTITPDLLVYGTGGLAYGQVADSGNVQKSIPLVPTSTFAASTSQTRVGWAAGAGAEWMFARGWSAKVEYLHVDFGSASATGEPAASAPQGGGQIIVVNSTDPARVGYRWHNSFDTVRAGVNYHFN